MNMLCFEDCEFILCLFDESPCVCCSVDGTSELKVISSKGGMDYA